MVPFVSFDTRSKLRTQDERVLEGDFMKKLMRGLPLVLLMVFGMGRTAYCALDTHVINKCKEKTIYAWMEKTQIPLIPSLVRGSIARPMSRIEAVEIAPGTAKNFTSDFPKRAIYWCYGPRGIDYLSNAERAQLKSADVSRKKKGELRKKIRDAQKDMLKEASWYSTEVLDKVWKIMVHENGKYDLLEAWGQAWLMGNDPRYFLNIPPNVVDKNDEFLEAGLKQFIKDLRSNDIVIKKGGLGFTTGARVFNIQAK